MASAVFSSSSSPLRTRSRRSDALLLMIAATIALAPSTAVAQPAASRAPARPDSTHRPKPFSVMLRSAAVPGWGQVTNHKYLKAGLVVGVEGFLVFQTLSELKKENQALDRQAEIPNGGGDITDPSYQQAALDEQVHRNRKVNWIWWGIAAHLLSTVDAYVDAHLASFDTDFGPPESAVDVGEKPRFTLAYRTRF